MTMDKDFKKVSIWFKFLFVIFLSAAVSLKSYAQERVTVTGKVTDAETNNPLPNVSVMVAGTAQEVVTDNGGNYTITAPIGSVLRFMYLASAPKDVKVQKAGTLNVTLDVKSKDLQEVVVIGYGSRAKKDVTGAVGTISTKQLEQSTSMSPELALQGNTAGVFVESGGGEPNARPTIRIRGVSTTGFNEPLYVIDGLPIFEGGAGVGGGAIGDIRTPINIFTLVNPNDIESMSVLKDASAAAIYGVRASNGVIIITTKKGKTGAPKVDFTASYGVQSIAKTFNTLNTQEYFSLLRESYAANPDQGVSFGQKFGDVYTTGNPRYQGNAATYNWQDELKNDNAPIQDYAAKVSGGTESINYYFSAGYGRTESPLKGNNLERYSTAFNIESKISKYIRAGLNIRLGNQNALDNTQGDIGTMIATIPFQPIYDPNDPLGFARVQSGTLIPDPDYDKTKATPGNSLKFETDPVALWGPQTRFNPFAFQALNSNKYNVFNTFGTAFFEVEPVTGLKLKATLGGDYRNNVRKNFLAFDQWRYSQTPQNYYSNAGPSAVGNYGERTTNTYNLNKNLTLNYVKTIAQNHNFNITLDVSDQYNRWKWNDVSNPVDYSNPQFWRVQNMYPYSSSRSGVLQEDRLYGYMGRMSYKFKDKYYLDATLRRDIVSKLAPGLRAETFPSFAAAWRISSESFFPKETFIDDLKIRGGWGRLGNFQSARAYQYLSNLSFTSDYVFGSGNGNNNGSQTPGAVLINYPNSELTWEKVETSGIGFDAVLFKTKVNLTAEYYNRNTLGMIQTVALAPNTGIQDAADINIGRVNNKGFEFQLGYNNRFGDVGFNASANLTTVKNNVQELYQNAPQGGELGRREAGYSLNYFWGYKVGGIFQNQAEIDAWEQKHPGGDSNIGTYNYQPGDMYFQDVNGDGTVNDADRTFLGKSVPGYFYGLNLGSDYKGFDFTVFFQGVGDVERYNGFRSGVESMASPANQLTTVNNRWTPENPSSTMPRAVFNDPSRNTRISDRFLEDASYLRLKTLQLGYTLNKSTLGKNSFAQRVRLYVSGINLLTATKYSGLDPENDNLPPTRQFIFGINASF